MPTILMATDLSPEADLALQRACQVAKRLHADLLVVHAVDSSMPLVAQDRLCKEARSQVEEQIARCPQTADLSVRILVESGHITECILRTSMEEDVQLIILGQHHQSTPELFVGTTLERVSRLAAVPVLLVARQANDYRQGVLALDFSACGSAALRMASMLVDGGKLQAVHICNPPLSTRLGGQRARSSYAVEQRATLEYLIKDELETLEMQGITKPEIGLTLAEGGVLASLLEEVKQQRPDFIALGSHGRSGIGEALLGSLALELLRQPPCDVLVAR